ncbi:MAG: cation-translocating P-type ATPase [Chitinophagaceae bacterium]|nr:cation-translocating P-type ATPase [Chitinophagaceae bacterium]
MQLPVTDQIRGLSREEIERSRQQFGRNEFEFKQSNELWRMLQQLLGEPMVILLLAASTLYFITGKIADAIYLAIAILIVAGISVYQHRRSRLALEKLKKYTQPLAKVIREGKKIDVPIADLVVGDYLVVGEGDRVAADARLYYSSDLEINESILTGESMTVAKDKNHNDPTVYQGTHIATGMAIAVITATGMHTRLGKIGKSLAQLKEQATPLEQQIGNFVKKMVIAGVLVFLVVWLINYSKSNNIIQSLLQALTLAMSILPEEIPVAFTSFMALGAWRLMQQGIIVKQMKTVETLGSADIICTDKTGTLTLNEMTLKAVYPVEEGGWKNWEVNGASNAMKELVKTGMWASEPMPYDPMEVSLHEAYGKFCQHDERKAYQLTKEYPLEGKPPMMTHVFTDLEGHQIIAAKGAPETILRVCRLDDTERKVTEKALHEMAEKGYRILGVAQSYNSHDALPANQEQLEFRLTGLLAFYDPPKENIKQVIEQFQQAGIEIKVLTGDNPVTTRQIAGQVGLDRTQVPLSGEEIMQLEGEELDAAVINNQLFARMFPEAKLKVIHTLQRLGKIVAMTGDGVNDGPALKAAHIGVAMGKRGAEVAKQAASMILPDDDLVHMLTAISMGRRIYNNLKKAIRYILSIHIPIILVVFIPLALGWTFPNIFSPIHIIFFELIMGPTCSIIYENEPAEANILQRPPRKSSTSIFNWSELWISVLQGLIITSGCLVMYQWGLCHRMNEREVRTLVFTTLIAANLFLTFENRSFDSSLFQTFRYPNKLLSLIISITLLLGIIILFVPVVRDFFDLAPIQFIPLLYCLTIALLSVIWIEILKWLKRRKTLQLQPGDAS